MRVLIVDDDPFSRRLLQNYLERWGYEIVQAENGLAAWNLLQGEDFPLVLVDWMMPEMDGVELVRRIRGAQRPGYVYVILLTARAQKEDLVEGMEAGADDFLSKPFDRDELRVRLREGERIVHLERTAADQSEELQRAKAALNKQLLAGSDGAAATPGSRQFDHIGMMTDQPQPGENWVEFSRVWVTNPRLHPQRIEYIRPEKFPEVDPSQVGLWKLWHLPHVAYRVEDLEAAVRGKEVVLGPFEPGDFGRVAFVQEDGVIVEYLQYTRLDTWFGEPTPWRPAGPAES